MSHVAKLTGDSWGELSYIGINDFDGDLDEYLHKCREMGNDTEICSDDEKPTIHNRHGAIVLRTKIPARDGYAEEYSYELFWEMASRRLRELSAEVASVAALAVNAVDMVNAAAAKVREATEAAADATNAAFLMNAAARLAARHAFEAEATETARLADAKAMKATQAAEAKAK